MNFLQVLFYALLLLLPLGEAEGFGVWIGPLYVSVVDILLVLILYFTFMQHVLRKKHSSPFVKRVCLLFFMASATSAVSMLYLPSSIITYDLKISLNMLEFCSIVFVAPLILDDTRSVEKALGVFCVSVLIISLLTVLKSLGLDIPGDVRARSWEYIGPFNMGVTAIVNTGMGFSTLILAAFPFVWLDEVIKSGTVRTVFGTVMCVAAVVAFSRNLWAALVVEFLVILALSRVLGSGRFTRAAAYSALAAAVLAIAVNARDIMDAVVGMRSWTFQKRMEGYFTGIRLITENPWEFLFGVGKGEFRFIEGAVPHNYILDVLISKGLVTLVFVATMLYYIFYGVVTAMRRADEHSMPEIKRLASMSLAALCGFAAFSLFAPLTNASVFWVFVSIVCSIVAIFEDRAGGLAMKGRGA